MLAEDGAVLIHIDEHEVATLEIIAKEIFGPHNYLGTIVWDKRNPKGVVTGIAYQHESILAFCKNVSVFALNTHFKREKENARTMIQVVKDLIKKYGKVTEKVRLEYKNWIKGHKPELSGGELAYSLVDHNGLIYQPVSMAAPDRPETRSHRPLLHPITGKPCPVPAKGWRFTDVKMDDILSQNKIEFGKDETTQPRQKYFLHENMEEAISSLLYFGGSDNAMELPFDNPKPLYVAKRLINSIAKGSDTILDFFSGSATTAHAVMKLNAEDGGNRKFIMVQLPELTDEKSEAYKAGYKNICEIGKERIRRAGKKIREENADKEGIDKLDTGFRVLKLDSSNMEDVYYTPQEFDDQFLFHENVKPDRSSEDLLFQVMLDLGMELSAKMETRQMAGKNVHFVDGNYLIACFDKDVNESAITEIARMKPVYFVMRDASAANDNVIDNFEQIFRHYSPDTNCRIL